MIEAVKENGKLGQMRRILDVKAPNGEMGWHFFNTGCKQLDNNAR